MNNWKEYKLKDICTIVSSKRIFAEQYVSEGIPFFRQKEIIELHSNQQISEPLYISHDVYEEMINKTGVPTKGDILLTAVGVTLGIPFLVNNEKFYFKDGNLIWLKDFSKNVDSAFLYYWLDSKFGWESIYMRAIGSAQPALTIDLVRKYKMQFPPLPTQQKIAGILSSYDNLIQNYKKQIEDLQTLASELYKEWFVRFRFPGWQNATFENGIPSGWKVERLGSFITFDRGVGYSSNDIEDGTNVLLSMNNIKPFGGFIRDYTRPYSGKYKEFQKVKENDLIMSITDMTQDRRIIGYVGMVPPNEGNLIISTHLLKLSSSKIDNVFLLAHFNYSNLSRVIAERATGTNVLGLTSDILKKVKTLLPSDFLINEYIEKVQPVIKKINNLNIEIDNLTQQRDLLLPRLMSGKLEVK